MLPRITLAVLFTPTIEKVNLFQQILMEIFFQDIFFHSSTIVGVKQPLLNVTDLTPVVWPKFITTLQYS